MSGTYFKSGSLVESTTTTATAGGTTTLTASSESYQQFTGVTSQTIVLPVATTLSVGRKFVFLNRSTGILTIKYADGSTTLTTVTGGTQTEIRVITNGTSNGTWDIAASSDGAGSSESEMTLQAYCMANSAGTPVGCSDPTVVLGKTRVVLDNAYPLAVTSGFANGALRVFLNGQKIPRYVDATLTPDASYTEINSTTIELDQDYSAYAYSIEIYQEVAVIDTRTTNTTDLVAIKGHKFQNLVINGNFDFWQRVSSNVTELADTIYTNAYTADRWLAESLIAAGCDFSMERSSDVPTPAESGFNSLFSLLATSLTTHAPGSAEYINPFVHFVEGHDFQAIYGKQVALTFWVKMSAAGTYSAAFVNGPQNKSYVTTFTVDAPNTWEFKNILVTLPSSGTWYQDERIGVSVYINPRGGSSYQTSSTETWLSGNYTTASGSTNLWGTNGATMQLAQVSLVEGTGVASDGFFRAGHSIQRERALCERFYCKTYDIDTVPGHVTTLGVLAKRALNTVTGAATMPFFYPVPMRVGPTFTIYSSGTGATGKMRDQSTSVDINASVVVAANKNQAVITNTGTAINGSTYYVHAVADSEY